MNWSANAFKAAYVELGFDQAEVAEVLASTRSSFDQPGFELGWGAGARVSPRTRLRKHAWYHVASLALVAGAGAVICYMILVIRLAPAAIALLCFGCGCSCFCSGSI